MFDSFFLIGIKCKARGEVMDNLQNLQQQRFHANDFNLSPCFHLFFFCINLSLFLTSAQLATDYEECLKVEENYAEMWGKHDIRLKEKVGKMPSFLAINTRIY